MSAIPALAQQKTGPGVPEDDSLVWHGITLYGGVDVGIQYDTHSAPFSPYRPAASGNIVRSNDYASPVGVTPSNMGQSRVGLQGNVPLIADWTGVFQVESFFNPQSGQLADSLKSLAVNNGKAVENQNIGVDGSSAGQAFQTAYVGLKSPRFGALSFGRQVSLLSAGAIEYDPNFLATAFGVLGASNTYAGAGSSETNRLDSSVKYLVKLGDLLHVGALYKFNDSGGSARTAYQADLGASVAGLSVDAFYSKINDAITATALSASQMTALAGLGYPPSDSLAATVSDNTTYALMGSYKLDPFRFFAGYEHIKYADPDTPLSAGYTDIGGYVLAFVTNNAFLAPKTVRVYWTGVRYTVLRGLDLTGAYYGVDQNAYGTKTLAGCTTAAHSVCSGSLEGFSFDADYRFNVHFDAYLGAMYSGVHDGMASGYVYSTNINPTVGVRYKF
ncbi:MAG TPA: porin [Steroidobacteraceae bacterium]